MHALNDDGKALRGARVLVLGLSYKANVDDDRESPSYEILELLKEFGARVDYCDPYFPVAHATRKHDLGLRSVPCTAEAFQGYDALVVSTAHDLFKDAALYQGVKLVVDSRNLLAPLFKAGAGPRVVKA
jgi:UDP-N-acetyl-D-glucosamine dehydrogenase